MPQQSMHNRPGRTSANAGGRRANIDVGGIAGATGALAPTGGVGSSPDINADPVESGYVDPKAGSPTANFTPYQASGWQNLLSRGQAGMQANQLNNAVLLQQMQNSGLLDRTKLENQGRMDVTGLEGANQQHNIVATGEQGRLTQKEANAQAEHKAILEQALGTASKYGITQEQMPAFMAEMSPLILSGAKLRQQVATGADQLTANAQNPALNPKVQDNANLGMNAHLSSDAARNIALTSTPLGENQVAFPFTSADQTSIRYGATPIGSSQTVSRDPNNPLATTTTSTVDLKPGGQFPMGPTGKPIVAPPSNSNNGNSIGQFIQGLTQPAMDTANTVSQFQQPTGIQQTVDPKPATTFQPGVLTKMAQQAGAGAYQGAQGMGAANQGWNDIMSGIYQYLIGKQSPSNQ